MSSQRCLWLSLLCLFEGIHEEDPLERVAGNRERKNLWVWPIMPAPCEAIIQKVVPCEQCIMQDYAHCSQGSLSEQSLQSYWLRAAQLERNSVPHTYLE